MCDRVFLDDPAELARVGLARTSTGVVGIFAHVRTRVRITAQPKNLVCAETTRSGGLSRTGVCGSPSAQEGRSDAHVHSEEYNCR